LFANNLDLFVHDENNTKMTAIVVSLIILTFYTRLT